MKKKILRSISICLLAAALLSTVAFATQEASEYILGTNVSIKASASNLITVSSTITATDSYRDVGIDWLKIYQEGKSEPVATYNHTSYPSLMGHNTGSHTATVTYQGTVGQKYYATVCFYAGDMYGSGGDTHTMGSIIVP